MSKFPDERQHSHGINKVVGTTGIRLPSTIDIGEPVDGLDYRDNREWYTDGEKGEKGLEHMKPAIAKLGGGNQGVHFRVMVRV